MISASLPLLMFEIATIAAGSNTSFAIINFLNPKLRKILACQKFAIVREKAPASVCIWAICGDIVVLTWGASSAPTDLQKVAIRSILFFRDFSFITIIGN